MYMFMYVCVCVYVYMNTYKIPKTLAVTSEFRHRSLRDDARAS